MNGSSEFRFFDHLADYGVVARDLPHWMQDKTVVFITWRTWDSIPKQVADRWRHERDIWLAKHKGPLEQMVPEQRSEYYRLFSARWEAWLDDCYGQCALRQRELATIVSDSLKFFDEARYLLTDFVVMPNHVHVLVAFKSGERMLKQCKSWKHFTAVEINKKLGRKGNFWESDSFDHLVRSEDQWRYLRDYIRENPVRARLRDGEFIHYSRTIF